MKENNILLYGFSKFNEIKNNPSETLVKKLSSCTFSNSNVYTKVFNVSYDDLKHRVEKIFTERDYDLVLGFGIWLGIPAIKLEKIAVNLIDSPIPDIDGNVIYNRKIIENSPEVLLTNIDLNLIRDTLLENNIPCYISPEIDTYICNYAYYLLLHHIKESGKNIKCGFIHIPLTHEYVCDKKKMYPSLSMATILRGSEIIVKESIAQLK